MQVSGAWRELCEVAWLQQIKYGPGPDGFRLAFGQPALWIGGRLHAMTRAERRALRMNPIRIGLLKHGCALFISFSIPDLGSFDCPYDHALVPEELRGLPERSADEGYRITLTAYDPLSEEAASNRAFTVSSSFSDALSRAVLALDVQLQSGAAWTYDRDVAAIYCRYPTPGALLSAASVVECAQWPNTPKKNRHTPAGRA